MIKVKNDICDKCGMEIDVPDYDETRPMSGFFKKYERASEDEKPKMRERATGIEKTRGRERAIIPE